MLLLIVLLALFSVSLAEFHSKYYDRIVLNTLEAPTAKNVFSDPFNARMLALNTPHTPIYTAADALTLRTLAIEWFYSQFAVDIAGHGVYNSTTDIWTVPGVGFMESGIFGGCNDTQSQSQVLYKNTFDTANPLRGRKGHVDWCLIEPGFVFVFETTGTVPAGFGAAGQTYYAFQSGLGVRVGKYCEERN